MKRRRGRGRRIGRVATLVLVAASARAADPESPTPQPLDCFDRPVVVRYLHALQDQIIDSWALPPDGMANRSVTVRLRLDEFGTLVLFEIASGTSPRLANSVLRAVAGAAPFQPLTANTACLGGRTIVTQFSNPS